MQDADIFICTGCMGVRGTNYGTPGTPMCRACAERASDEQRTEAAKCAKLERATCSISTGVFNEEQTYALRALIEILLED